MSRSIPAKHSVTVSDNERGLLDTESGKLVFTEYKGRHCALLLKGGRLIAAGFYDPAKPDKIGAVYIGKVKNMAKNIDACFVEMGDGEICFLPLKKATSPFLTNRAYDGRLLEGDELLVQVERDAQKSKQACVTANISLADDYFAVVLGSHRFGFSSRLKKEKKDAVTRLFTERAMLRDGCLTGHPGALLNDSAEVEALRLAGLIEPSSETDTGSAAKTNAERNVENGTEHDVDNNAGKYPGEPCTNLPPVGAIARTRLEELTDSDDVLASFFGLTTKLYRLLRTALTRSCFSCLLEAPAPWEAQLKELAAPEEYTQIVTDDPDLYECLAEYCETCLPGKEVRLYQDSGLSLSKLYALESKLDTALKPKVWLRSGGYLVIEPTEALTVIDVNSGKSETGVGGDALRRLNHEAAEEIALQLRLRNLSGIILVDFINMKGHDSGEELLEHLRELVRGDRVRTEVVDITPLGLAELTRTKKRQPLAEQFREG